MYMKVNNVISFESQFVRRVIKSASNVSFVEDSAPFMYDSNCRRTGGGLIYKYKRDTYVLSCSHIFPRGNKSAYFFGDTHFEMHPFISLKEMDVQIFKCTESGHIHTQFDLDEYLSNFADTRGEYKLITPDSIYDVSDIDIIHESNISPLYPSVPTVIAKIPKIHPDKLCGISGSIITRDNCPIGLVSNYNSSKDIIKCMHIPFVLSLVKCLTDRYIERSDRRNDIPVIELTGVDINTDVCDIEYSLDTAPDDIISATVHYIADNSKEYTGDIRMQLFEKDSLIVNVNDNMIDSHGLINCSDILNIDLKISLGAYSMVSTTLTDTVSYSVINQHVPTSNPEKLCVKGLTYDNIFKIHPLDNLKRVIWNNYVFCEMSTELIYNYESKGAIVSNIEKNNTSEYYDNTRRIILLTHIETSDDTNKKTRKICEYKFPMVKEGIGIYFMTLIKVGKNNVRDINHLYDLLSSYKRHEATFIFTTLIDTTHKEKISI